MRTLKVWGATAILLGGVGLAGGVAAEKGADTKAAASSSNWGWFNGWFGANKKDADKDKKSDVAKTAGKDAESSLPPSRPLSQADEATAARAREEAILFRRLAVCNKLMEIALQTNDKQLQGQAEQLDERAWAIYNQRTANLPTRAAELDLDERVLEKNARKETSQGRALWPSSRAAGRDSKSTAAREDRP